MNKNTKDEVEKLLNAFENPEQKLEALRSFIFANSPYQSGCYIDKYFELFDKPEKGYDNYAEEILSNIKNLNNESHLWKSDLDSNKLIDQIMKAQNNSESFLTEFQISEETREKAVLFETQPIKIEIRSNLPSTSTKLNESVKNNHFTPSLSAETSYFGGANNNFSTNLSSRDRSTKSIPNSNCSPGTLSFGISNDSSHQSPILSGFGVANNNFSTNFSSTDKNRKHIPNSAPSFGISQGSSHQSPISSGFGVANNNFSTNLSTDNNRKNIPNSAPSFGISNGSPHQFSDRYMKTNMNFRQQKESSEISPLAAPKLLKSGTSNYNENYSMENSHFKNESGFRTAKDQLSIDLQKKNGNVSPQVAGLYGSNRKSLGTRKGVWGDFVAPIPGNKNDQNVKKEPVNSKYEAIIGHESLKQFEPAMIESLLNEIMDSGKQVDWNDIAGLESPKKILQEIVILPMLRPDIFTGIRSPPKGLLLFGPPGTGKTLIGKCIASQSKSTFFSISASSLTSKWVGDGEKTVRVMFTVARLFQPAVIFIDEIDSLLSQRNEKEHESSRKIKTEFLIQMDGVGTGDNDRILLIGATNRPQEIDEAARRRFVKRVYIPLPSKEARRQIMENMLRNEYAHITSDELDLIVEKSDGYSGADMTNLCKEAAMGPVRNVPYDQLANISLRDVPPINYDDFLEALNNVKSSVSPSDLEQYVKWDEVYGSSFKRV